MRRVALFTLGLIIMTGFSSRVLAAPVKVYILAGQSNAQGHAKVSTFDYIGKDPKTADMLKDMIGPDGKPMVCENVWISHVDDFADIKAGAGKLTAGYGADYAPGKPGIKIGPEFTFGIYMQKHVKEPILIIKAAWGGKSLHSDFRPPSAGPHPDPAKAEASGKYYRLMMDHVKKVLADPKQAFPAYNPAEGYEVAGFVWFQGWNDMVDGGAYPNRAKAGGYAQYSEVMAHFIRDVRKDLGAPKMRFVIGVLGVGGPTSMYDSPRYKGVHQNFRDAMAAPAAMPEFKDNVVAVLTENFWDHKLEAAVSKKEKTAEDTETAKGASNQGFHYLGSAKILGQIGKAFAEAMAGTK
jgi:hypothetical protein